MMRANFTWGDSGSDTSHCTCVELVFGRIDLTGQRLYLYRDASCHCDNARQYDTSDNLTGKTSHQQPCLRFRAPRMIGGSREPGNPIRVMHSGPLHRVKAIRLTRAGIAPKRIYVSRCVEDPRRMTMRKGRESSDRHPADVISLADEDAVKEAVWSSILGLWDVVNTLTRLRPSRSKRYRVCIFGSARVKPGTLEYDETKRAAKALAVMGCDIITGGGPGLMQAANEGAASAPARSRSYGIRVALPFEQNVNAFVSKAFEHRTFFTRLHQFVIASDAFIVAPGGVGTVLEMIMIWQLLQVRHVQRNTPLILVGKMWPGLIAWAKSSMLAVNPPLASREDMAIPVCVPDADKAIALVRKHHRTWLVAQKRSSMRRTRDRGRGSKERR